MKSNAYASPMVGLEHAKLFQGLSPAEMAAVIAISTLKQVPAQQAVFREGDPGHGMFVVAQGKVGICASVPGQDAPQWLSHLGPGEYFGEMAVLDDGNRSATAMAEEPCALWFIPREGLLKALERSPLLAFTLVREFSRRLRDFDRQYVQELLQAERLALVGRFARSIVHDFKNPLAIINLAADLGAMEKATPEMRRLAQTRINHQVARLTDMINELLEFTRGAQASNVLSPLNYPSFINQLLEEIRPDAAQKAVILQFENPPPDLRLFLDPRRLSHAIHNLINNAMDAMPGGGRITLRFFIEAGYLVTEIEDDGPGIAPEIRQRLFQPFATFGKTHGTGLGLSISQRIIQDHKGSISIREQFGRGAIFQIRLPLVEDHA
jgi:signal transduction histidine kinase